MRELNGVTVLNYQKLFESTPGLYLVLTPEFIIAAVTNDYLKTSRKKRDEILGKYLFDEFPDNPNDPNANGVSNLTASLNKVLTEKVPHIMDILKYDIPLPEGGFEAKYWKTENIPIFDENNNLTHIIHKTEDVTEVISLKKQEKEQIRINQVLQIKSDSMEEEFNQIARELKSDQISGQEPQISVKQAVKELESERAKFHNLLNNAPAYVSLLESSEHIFTFTNPPYQKLTNNRPVIGKTVREAWPEMEGQGFFELLDQVYTTGKPFIGNENVVMIDIGNGKLEQKYMNFVYQPVFEIDNKISGISSYSYDVTEQVLARQKLEALTKELSESEAKYKNLAESLEEKVKERTAELNAEKNKFSSLFQNAPTGVTFLRGEEHIYEFVNPFYQEVVAGNNRKVLGKAIRDAFPELDGQGISELYDEVYKTGKPIIGKERLIKLDKEGNGILKDCYFDFIYQPIFDINNRIEGISTFAFDITEQVSVRKEVEKLNRELSESEAKYRNLAESLEVKVRERTEELSKANNEIEYQSKKLNKILVNAPAMIAVLEGPKHIFSLSNSIFQKATGNRDFIGKPYREALYELEGQGFFEILDEVYDTGKPFIGNEILVKLDRNSDGILDDGYFNFVFEPIFDIDNQVEGISVFAFEVTVQVIARENVKQLNKNLNRSNEELQSFAYIASHDLQEPLRTLTSYSQLLAKRYKNKIDADADDFIDFIISATRRMKDLIEDVLSHSKINKKHNDEDITNLNYVIENIKHNLKTSFEENKVILNYETLPSVKAGNAHMLQLFQNLISNAIKYRKKGIAPVINISARQEDKEWIFSVSDNGIGIEPQYSDKIFEIFKRLHGREEYEGTGIGLASCKKIVEIYGGKIWVESEEGKGSTFFFSLK